MKIKRSEILSEMFQESKMGRLGVESLLWSIYVTMRDVGLFNERERGIFSMIIEGSTLEEVSKKYDITKERVRQIFCRSLRRARYAIEKFAYERKKIEEYKKRIEILEVENRILRKESNTQDTERLKISLLIDMEFSVRALSCFKTAKIETLEELIRTPSTELLKYRNIGRKTIMEIRDYMKAHNIDWE